MIDANPIKKKITNIKLAKTKIEHFCVYQERSQQEVRSKLYDWGLWKDAVEEIIADLVTDNFINEERFANAYASGKFRMKGWGKIKIKQGLKLKGISDYCIKNALSSIDLDDYHVKMKEVLLKRERVEKEKNAQKRIYKLANYLISRGYESDIVWRVLKTNE